jgi:hypothetical protein
MDLSARIIHRYQNSVIKKERSNESNNSKNSEGTQDYTYQGGGKNSAASKD